MTTKTNVSQYDGTLVKVGATYVRVDRGAAVPDNADAAHVALLVERGMVAKGEPAAGFVDPGGVQPFEVVAEPDADSGAGRPAKAAEKAAWVDFAVAQGADRAEAEASSKQDLIATYGD